MTPEAFKLKGEDWDEVTPTGNPTRLTEAVPENPFCGIKLRLTDAVELGDIVKVDGLASIENDGGGGGGGDELPPPQLISPTIRISSADEMTALRTFIIEVFPGRVQRRVPSYTSSSIVSVEWLPSDASTFAYVGPESI